MTHPSKNVVQTGWCSRLLQDARKIAPWVLSLVAILAALKLAHIPVFQRISFVISDEISRKLRAGNTGSVVLLRLDRSFSKSDLEQLLSASIPTLVTDYRPRALGVDIEFSGRGYNKLAGTFAKWSTNNPELASKVVWAVGYDNLPRRPADELPGQADTPFCEDCSGLACKVRFTPKSVFDRDWNPNNYGLAIGFPDLDGVNRSSARFVCHSESEQPLKAFHFKLVETYCEGRWQIVTCRELQHNKQAKTTIYSWYRTQPVDLCQLVSCRGDLGAKAAQISDQLADKIVLLYSDTPASDEHMTMVGARKGAEIVASLIENELLFGVAPPWRVSALECTLEAMLTLLLIFLFHWRYTRSWAILLAAAVFVLYLYLLPQVATWVPDFRNYVLAVILTFWIEVLLKSAWHSLASRP